MTAATLVTLVAVLSIFLVVYSLGARTSFDDALYLFRRPVMLLRAMLAIYVVVPAFALALCLAFPLTAPAKFALIALTASPIPPVLPTKQMNVGAESRYAVGLLVAAAMLALVMTPLLLALAGRFLGSDVSVSAGAVAKPLLMSIALPLSLGILLKHFAPAFADRTHAPALKLGSILLLVVLVLLFAVQFRTIVSLAEDGTILAIVATVAAGLLAGHVLGGGGDGGDGGRAALALAAATRHPGVAIAIAAFNFPDQKHIALSAVLLFVLVNMIVTLPYVRWTKGRAAQAADP